MSTLRQEISTGWLSATAVAISSLWALPGFEFIMKWKRVRFLFGGLLCLTALLAIHIRTDGGDLRGTWLTTLVFVGRRPIQATITFEDSSPPPSEEPGHGRWTRINPNEFSIEFRLASELKTGPDLQYRVNGTLKLDRELGRLRGPVSGAVLDANGTIIDTLQGAVKAIRISQDKGPR